MDDKDMVNDMTPVPRTAIISRLCAIWLVVLGVLPFTAPFAPVDLLELRGHTANVFETDAAAASPTANEDEAVVRPERSEILDAVGPAILARVPSHDVALTRSNIPPAVSAQRTPPALALATPLRL